MPWNARSLRFTLFPGPGVSADQLSWRHLTGNGDPDTQLVRGGQQHQEGPFSRGRLALVKQLPLRIDVYYAAAPRGPDEELDGIPNIGLFQDVIDEFLAVAQHAFQLDLAVQRIALGAVLDNPARDQDEAYHFLIDHIRSARFDLAGAREFTYQVNRPRASRAIPDLTMNRLAKWSAIKLQSMAIEAGTGRVATGRETFAATLELDLSTAGDYSRLLPTETLDDLLRELRDLALEISERGDVA